MTCTHQEPSASTSSALGAGRRAVAPAPPCPEAGPSAPPPLLSPPGSGTALRRAGSGASAPACGRPGQVRRRGGAGRGRAEGRRVRHVRGRPRLWQRRLEPNGPARAARAGGAKRREPNGRQRHWHRREVGRGAAGGAGWRSRAEPSRVVPCRAVPCRARRLWHRSVPLCAERRPARLRSPSWPPLSRQCGGWRLAPWNQACGRRNAARSWSVAAWLLWQALGRVKKGT